MRKQTRQSPDMQRHRETIPYGLAFISALALIAMLAVPALFIIWKVLQNVLHLRP